MTWSLWSRRQHAYSPLTTGEKEQTRVSRPYWIVVLLCFTFFGGFLSYPLMQLPEQVQVFQYNRSFTQRPSEQTDRAWRALLPRRGGYFRHPELAPSRSAFAVFHQLHCLDAIRTGYWTALDAALAGEKKDEKDFPFMASPPHVRHCIDLIRQALMCQPDLTVEVKDEAKGGVTGFGIEHQCIQWDSLLSWVGEWESYR